MKICHITTVHKITDNRIFYKQCRSLQKYGHNVFLIGSYEQDVDLDGVNILSLPFEGLMVHVFGKIAAAILLLKYRFSS